MNQFDPFRQAASQLPAGAAPHQPQGLGWPTTPQIPETGPSTYPQAQYGAGAHGYPPQTAYPQQPLPQAAYPAAAQGGHTQPYSDPQSPYQPAGVAVPTQPVGHGVPLSARQAPTPLRPIPANTGSQPHVQQPVVNRPTPTAPANRPVPVSAANRPVPVTKADLDPGKPKIDEEKTEKETDVTEKAIKKAPPWLISTVIHMVVIIVLAMIYIVPQIPNQISLEAIYAEKLGEQVLDDTLQSPEALNMEVEVPTLAFDSKMVDDPFAAPPELDMISLDATKAAAESFDAPSIGLALTGREAGAKKALLAAYGGNATTEEAVRMGLDWLAKNQMNDGSWSLTGPYSEGGGVENKVSATAMALLAFQGAGHTHQEGDFKKQVAKGWEALLKMQTPDGLFESESALHHRLYAQAQATIAVCEIYGMTKDEKFRLPAQKALDFAHKAQAPEGGWRYEPKIDSDTSVTGWYVMALQSGMMAGLEVQSPALDKINQFLDKASLEDGSRYCYKPGMEATLTMTAEGLLCRQYLGWKHSDPRLKAGIDYVLANPVNYNDQNVYYWYYATQAAHHMDGDEWNRWNMVMRQAVPTAQTKTGAERGSWSPSGDRWGSHGGRLYVTCLSIYMLEVYYRHLPIYKYRLQ
jgi:hypothetical protein